MMMMMMNDGVDGDDDDDGNNDSNASTNTSVTLSTYISDRVFCFFGLFGTLTSELHLFPKFFDCDIDIVV